MCYWCQACWKLRTTSCRRLHLALGQPFQLGHSQGRDILYIHTFQAMHKSRTLLSQLSSCFKHFAGSMRIRNSLWYVSPNMYGCAFMGTLLPELFTSSGITSLLLDSISSLRHLPWAGQLMVQQSILSYVIVKPQNQPI